RHRSDEHHSGTTQAAQEPSTRRFRPRTVRACWLPRTARSHRQVGDPACADAACAGRAGSMILRIDRLGVELPPPSTPDPEGAAAVQELMGGKFGEMSTLMNYTFQSFNFRYRQGARPFYDLIANIAAEEYG